MARIIRQYSYKIEDEWSMNRHIERAAEDGFELVGGNSTHLFFKNVIETSNKKRKAKKRK